MFKTNAPTSICTHLSLEADEYYVWFTGRGAEYHWVCDKCQRAFPELPESLVTATETLIRQCLDKATWEGICGTPEIATRVTSLTFSHWQSGPLPQREQWLDVAPDLRSQDWLVLLASGELAILRPRAEQLDIAFRIPELGFSLDEETALCVSPWGDFAAVYQASGQHGCVFDLNTGEVATKLDRGEYRPDNSHFPAAFFRSGEQTLLVAATSWNRLDIVDPASGAILTRRELPSWTSGEPRPEHYLDYFHARLSVSPGNHWIANWGWHWAPYGVLRSWNLESWRLHNPWESEDGSSLKHSAGRHYFWDGPLCWIDDTTLAIWGFGDDDEWLLPAVQFLDVVTGEVTGWFPGPEATKPNAWPPKKQLQSLYFDQYLFSAGPQKGVSVWDVQSGERLLHDATIQPVQYHPRSREFLSLTDDGVKLSQLQQ